MLLAVLLSACGGGGSDSPTAPAPAPAPAPATNSVTFVPQILQGTDFSGKSLDFDFWVVLSGISSESLNIKVDTTGDFTPQITRATNRFKISSAASLAPGSYSGNITISLCRDSATICQSPYPGSPWRLPYSFTILSKTPNITPLQKLTGAQRWGNLRANASQTGYITSTKIDESRFNLRWINEDYYLEAGSYSQSPVIGEDRVVVYQNSSPLGFAGIREFDGTVAWKNSSASTNGVFTNLALLNNKVFLLTQNSLFSFDVTTGQQIAATNSGAYYPSYMVAHDNSIFVGRTGPGFGFLKFDAESLTQQWAMNNGDDPIQPFAVDAKELISVHGIRVDRASGVKSGFSRSEPINNYKTSENSSIMVNGQNDVIFSYFNVAAGSSSHISSYSRSSGTKNWIINGSFSSSPVLANNIIYTTSNISQPKNNEFSEVKAIDALTGKVIWTLPLPGPLPGNSMPRYELLLVGNHLFASQIGNPASALLAVEISKQQIVWRYPISGRLAVSDNGVLYVFGSRPGLTAINLH